MTNLRKYNTVYKICVDKNGNKVVRVQPREGMKLRGFSVQTNGNLPSWHKMPVGSEFTARSGSYPMTGIMALEWTSHIYDCGTKRQRERFFVDIEQDLHILKRLWGKGGLMPVLH